MASLFPWFRRKLGRLYFAVSNEDRPGVIRAHARVVGGPVVDSVPVPIETPPTCTKPHACPSCRCGR